MTGEQDTCQHLDVTDEGLCLVCGIDINSEEFINSLPPVPEGVMADDLIGIIQLVRAAALEYRSTKDKLRWMGSQLIRVPDSTAWSEVLEPTYSAAKRIGYRGTYQRWGEICKEFFETCD